MSKYAPLKDFLTAQDAAEIPMTFAEIERVLGAHLPMSKQHPAWWSNNPSNNVMTRAWLQAGFRSERVDIAREQLVFRREAATPPPAAAAPAEERFPGGFFTHIRAALGGTVRIAPGVDLTAPMDERWSAMED